MALRAPPKYFIVRPELLKMSPGLFKLGTDSECLFLTRTYVYPIKTLKDEERVTLKSARSNLSPKIAEYKGLDSLAPSFNGRSMVRFNGS